MRQLHNMKLPTYISNGLVSSLLTPLLWACLPLLLVACSRNSAPEEVQQPVVDSTQAARNDSTRARVPTQSNSAGRNWTRTAPAARHHGCKAFRMHGPVRKVTLVAAAIGAPYVDTVFWQSVGRIEIGKAETSFGRFVWGYFGDAPANGRHPQIVVSILVNISDPVAAQSVVAGEVSEFFSVKGGEAAPFCSKPKQAITILKNRFDLHIMKTGVCSIGIEILSVIFGDSQPRCAQPKVGSAVLKHRKDIIAG